MKKIPHRFIDHKLNSLTETLVIGTFNPDVIDNPADFFYSRQRNFLWLLIPTAFYEHSLKGKTRKEKLEFIERHRIDFIDLISEVEVENTSNYEDRYLDDKISKWRNVISEIKDLNHLKRVCLTRKTLTDIPNIKIRIEEIKKHCNECGISFQALTTPARFYSDKKQREWSAFFND